MKTCGDLTSWTTSSVFNGMRHLFTDYRIAVILNDSPEIHIWLSDIEPDIQFWELFLQPPSKKYNKIPICSVYGDIVEEDGKFKTTGCERTGCMFCCFGATNDKEPTRFQRMELTHPTQYQWMLKPYEEGSLGLQKVLDFLHIPYKNQPPE